MNPTEKYFIQNRDTKNQYVLITLIKNYSIVVHGVSEATPSIEITHFESEAAAEQEINMVIKAKLEAEYKEAEKPDHLSVFSIAMEQLKTEDVSVFEKNLLTLKTLVDAYSSRDNHPFTRYLGVKMKDESLVAVEVLDEYLLKHIDNISSTTLVSVFQMTLQNIYFNFQATGLVAEEIIKRKDVAAQLAIVDQFYEACEYYDAGHRFWGNTTLDNLIDDYFPNFESESLLKLLEKASGDMLNKDGGDEMDELFAPALHHTEDSNIQQNILKVLEAYKTEYEEEGYVEEGYFEELLDAILESASESVKKGINQLINRKEHRAALLEAISNTDLELIENLLNEGLIPDASIIQSITENALEKKDLSVLKLCKSKGILYDTEALFNKAENNVDVLIECIQSDLVDINYINTESNKNLLFFVSEEKNLLEILLKKGIDVNHSDNDGHTILDRVCSYARGDNEKYIAVVKLLLEYHANPNSCIINTGWEEGTMPLHYAVENKAIQISKLLINASADVNAKRKNGDNPLILAHKADDNTLIDLLIQTGATAPEHELLKIKFLRYGAQKAWEQIIDMEAAITLAYPDDFTVILRLAEAHYFFKSNYSEAAVYANRALVLKANNNSLNILIMSLIRLGQVQKTIDVFLDHKESFKPNRMLADNIIGNLVMAYCVSGQLKEGLEVLSPYFSKVEESRSARGVMSFNIACMYALLNDIHEMLPYVINALEREYTKADFLNDNDFANFHDNELFLFILNQDHKKNIELEEYVEDTEANSFIKLEVKAFYNTGSFSFENEDHEYSYQTGIIGGDKKESRRLYESKAQALTVFFNKRKKMSLEDKNMYFILKEDDSNFSLKAPKGVTSTLDFISGTKITAAVEPLAFTTNAKSGDTLLDFYNGKILVMSKRFIDMLEEAGVTTLQTFPVIIKSEKDKTVWENYFAINILDAVACGAFPASIFKENGPKHGIRCELAIDTEKVNDNLLFRLKEHLPTIILHRNVAKHLIDNDPDEVIKWEFSGIIH
ncbi:ankyrin repeat domain-containing protein [Tamlana sp. 2_MG-2023]|uniref:ankyrin repeat domain-containing protein n=1 Tax=unclassified Tamlana TaxID=2614803 RepID=UPI0026E28532|nr:MULTISPECIES: ankyrin repeat domain-containing protein [unclassified Tamlana]MDO6758823.1 ankyrin repeat domain-containing protein [Tamlana sp. 2_MG-2023]MDO6789522.1 ankyrin repeat domain-containing protein [Tamlana sp. 1_MG-2023]